MALSCAVATARGVLRRKFLYAPRRHASGQLMGWRFRQPGSTLAAVFPSPGGVQSPLRAFRRDRHICATKAKTKMCGIAGTTAATPARMEAFCASLAHRGPDARGVWLENDVGL